MQNMETKFYREKKWIFIKGFVITYYYFIFIQKLDRVLIFKVQMNLGYYLIFYQLFHYPILKVKRIQMGERNI